MRLHRYLGLEATYFDSSRSKKSGILGTTASSSVKFQGESLDVMGYLPLGESKSELIGLVGVDHASANSSVTISGTTYKGTGGKTYPEFGGGMQYWLTDNLNTRFLVRYEDINSTAINNAISSSIGLNYQFQ